MEVQLCNSKGVPVLAWRMTRTIPIKITAPTFDAKTNEAAIDVMEIKASGISIVPLS
jgi:phage tail-like protein